jgi:hypothetical protein
MDMGNAYGGRLRQGLLMYCTAMKTEMAMRRIAMSGALFGGRCSSASERKKAAMREERECVCVAGDRKALYTYGRWQEFPAGWKRLVWSSSGLAAIEVFMIK